MTNDGSMTQIRAILDNILRRKDALAFLQKIVEKADGSSRENGDPN